MHADISLPWSGSRSDKQHRPSSLPRSFDHLIAPCSHPKVYMPNCALALPAPCVPPFLHRNCGVALGVWMFKVLPFFGVFHSLTIPAATSRKVQGRPGRKTYP